MLSQHEPVTALLAIVIVLAGLLLLAEITDNVHGSAQVQAEYAGFDALVHRLLDGQVATVAGK
jgi:hypothetical protein